MEQTTDMETKETKNHWNGAKDSLLRHLARQKTVLQQRKGLGKEADPAAPRRCRLEQLIQSSWSDNTSLMGERPEARTE
jgi:hypothetical protein